MLYQCIGSLVFIEHYTKCQQTTLREAVRILISEGLLNVPALFYLAAVLVDFYGRAVQHYRRLIHQILPDQGMEHRFLYICPRPCAEAAVHALPWAITFRQVTPGDPCVEPGHIKLRSTFILSLTKNHLYSIWAKSLYQYHNGLTKKIAVLEVSPIPQVYLPHLRCKDNV